MLQNKYYQPKLQVVWLMKYFNTVRITYVKIQLNVFCALCFVTEDPYMLVIGKLVLKRLFYEKERQIYQDLACTNSQPSIDRHVTEK